MKVNSNFNSPAALFRFFGICLIGLAADLFTKVLAVRRLEYADRFIAIRGWLEFKYTENRGAVFGLGQGQRWLFIAVSLVAIVFLTWLFATSGRQRIYQILLGLLLAGVLGNMFDRIEFGYVRDMIYALPNWHWPGTWHIGPYPQVPDREVFPYIFNIADCMLCTGVFCMIVYSLLNPANRIADSKISNDETRNRNG